MLNESNESYTIKSQQFGKGNVNEDLRSVLMCSEVSNESWQCVVGPCISSIAPSSHPFYLQPGESIYRC